jgi:sporulation protein YqfC
MFNKINNFIKDNEFIINLFEDKIYIKNYQRLVTLENNYISLYTNKKKIIIKGKNMNLNKILDKELLIIGEFVSIEVIDE